MLERFDRAVKRYYYPKYFNNGRKSRKNFGHAKFSIGVFSFHKTITLSIVSLTCETVMTRKELQNAEYCVNAVLINLFSLLIVYGLCDTLV